MTQQLTGSTAPEPWFVAAFRREYLEVYAHRNGQDAKHAVDSCVESLGIKRGDRLLDLCCGAGRHLKHFEALGFDCVGVDLSQDLLERAITDGIRSRLVRADARSLPLSNGSFDALVNLFSSFGYFEDEIDHAVMVGEARRVLGLGGTAVFDIMNPAWLVATLKEFTVEERGDLRIESRRSIDVKKHRVNKRVRVMRSTELQPVTEYTESVRMFTPAEFDALLTVAKFEVVDRFGDFSRAPYDEKESPRQIVVAKAV